ncbi:KRR1 family protein, putative isoform 1 [Theobroma cacao]|uniref:KRR1 family protein, putative isoform 1 n=1 Tax=Theobroma cacao TaxID=3641 RepID=A0A061EY94_THECC|nr:KRR1 family protein, putative isoform 1 [Theobroma cacao]EOY09751.1 KRR1 family protein, putative isoform 1 [Theobroma cacao]
MGVKLFKDNEDAQNDDISKIEINKEYARRFEHNKKREDLQRYEELKKRGHVEESDDESDEDSSSSDGEDEGFDDKTTLRKKDEDFFKALIMVRSHDPRLKEKDVKLFESDDDESSKQEEENEPKEKKDKKAMYLKDVVAKHLMEEGPDFQQHVAVNDLKKKVKSYDEEQEEIKKALLDATEEVDNEDDGDFLRVKETKGKDEGEKEDLGDGEFSKKLEEYFGEDEKMDENTKFLKEFFKNKMWIDKEKTAGDLVVDNEAVDDALRDEEEIERQEGYELEYNFRHEENAEDRVIGYSRKVEGSVRKKESKRKVQRERKEERMRIAEMERKEELKHLKNLKKEEIKERMKKVMEIAGIKRDEECPFSAKDLEEEFDPEEYDKMMKAAFDEKYYDDDDMEFNSDSDGIEKPDFDKEDELLGLPKGWDVLESHEGFLAARERNKHKLQKGGGNDTEGEEEMGEEEKGELKNEEEEEEEEEDDDDDEGKEHKNEDEEDDEERKEEEIEEGKRKRKRKLSIVQKALQEMWEEFYNLDYEDTIGDLKTRFKYVKTKPNRYGLKPKELLTLDEKELNQYVSLKKLAPYTDKEWKVPNSKRYQQKLRIRELLKEKQNYQKAGKKRSRDAAEQSTSRIGGGKEDKKAKLEDSDGNMLNLSNQGKKKRRQASNISESRRKAYGMISSKPKKNKLKH